MGASSAIVTIDPILCGVSGRLEKVRGTVVLVLMMVLAVVVFWLLWWWSIRILR